MKESSIELPIPESCKEYYIGAPIYDDEGGIQNQKEINKGNDQEKARKDLSRRIEQLIENLEQKYNVMCVLSTHENGIQMQTKSEIHKILWEHCGEDHLYFQIAAEEDGALREAEKMVQKFIQEINSESS